MKAHARMALDVWKETRVDLPEEHDAARKAVKQIAATLSGGKVRSISSLVAGGFAVIVEIGHG